MGGRGSGRRRRCTFQPLRDPVQEAAFARWWHYAVNFSERAGHIGPFNRAAVEQYVAGADFRARSANWLQKERGAR